ncbi:MAG: outer membrane protein assembly factor BamA [Desulfobacteraceae bacterium]|nr:outer membrane protein assembly factor BamA [Desulfobacteraceae bacterium]
MILRFCLSTILIVALLITPCHSDEMINVAVFPFDIYADEGLEYLRSEIQRALGDYLKQEGATLVELDKTALEALQPGDLSPSAVKKLGVAANADFVILGSLTRIQEKYSLDASVIDVFDTAAGPVDFYTEGEGIETLLASVKRLSQLLGNKLFKHQLISDIAITGNVRIETDAILRVVKSKPGQKYSPKGMADDLKAIFALGYFEDIRILSEEGANGKAITFQVTEKPTIKRINFSGNHILDDDDLREVLTLNTGAILNLFKINNNISMIELLYKEKNYHNVKVEYKVHELKKSQADLEFIISEGKKVRIKTISFEGNHAYDDKKLKKLMKTSEKGFFSFFTSSGDLKNEDLDQDIATLTAFYHNNGYIYAKVGEPLVEYTDEWIFVDIKIEENDRFKVGRIDLEGDLVAEKEQLLASLLINEEEFYNREVVRNDVTTLSDLYSDEGYAYAEIIPRIDEDPENLVANITFSIKKGEHVYFEKIIINGNTITRDKVIRRELAVYEQSLFSGKQLKRGVRNLYRLDFFDDIRIDTVKGSADDLMVLKIDVTEKPTGLFTFGGGWSSVENFFVTASVAQRNLFGRGQTLQFKADFGAVTNRYTLSFTEPYLFDMPLSAKISAYNQYKDQLTYKTESIGGSVGFGYPVFDFTRAYLTYAYDVTDIKDIEDDASKNVKELSGQNVSSGVTGALRYDSRDRLFNPTEGANHRISAEYTGLGGDIAFTKYLAETGWYVPIYKGLVGFVHGEGGYVYKNPTGKLPDYEKFYLGGPNSLRGFGYKDIHVEDSDGDKIGGNTYVQGNLELIFPIFEKAGVMGVVFYDTGNVFGREEAIDVENLRQSAGYGFRWYSPLGPMRIENGYILDPRDGEETGGRWEFTMGQAF